jgi:tetratricopeptide (TPR) repeat protein
MDETWGSVTKISHDEFASAIRLHQAGDLDAATRIYESILHGDKTNADAIHLLGVVRQQHGQTRLAVRLISQAVSLRPENAIFRATLGEAYRVLGEFALAACSCQSALELGLNDPAVHNNLGLALLAMGRHADAATSFRAALELRPGDAMAHTNLGAALRAMDAKEQALDQFRRALAIDPKLAAAHTNVGQLLLELGQPAEALAHCRESVLLQGDLAEAHNNLGNAHRALGQLPEARACYEVALELKPGLAQAHANIGLALQQEGRWDDALPWLRRATELEPDSLAFLELLAAAAVDRERYDEAIDCYKRMVDIDSGGAATHNALGWLLQEQGLLEEANNHLRKALHLRPDLAIAHLNLGALYEKMGDLGAAESSLRAALPDPNARAPALARLAMLLRNKLPEPECEAIEERLANADPADPARVNLLYGLAYVWDARQRFTDAAACAREANALSTAQLQRRKLAYDPAVHERLVSGLIAVFDPAFFARLMGAGPDVRRPAFVFGMPRSGTSLIEQVLACHSKFHGAGELLLAQQAFEAIPEVMERTEPPLECIAGLTPAAVRQLALWYERQLVATDGGTAERIIDKMPENYIYLGLLATLFPRALFIHCWRDPRDVATSCWLTGFRSVRWASDTRHIISRFQEYDRLMHHWRSVLPTPIHVVHYEQIVADPEGETRRLLAACEMEWEPACLEFHRSRRPVRTASSTQVRQPMYRGSIGRWKNYESELADLFEALPRD